MFNKFYTKQELMDMPLVVLRGLDIDSVEQQQLVQEVVNVKLSGMPPQNQIFRQIVPDITTPEQEAEWQAKINVKRAEWEAGLKPLPTSEPIMETEMPGINPPGVYTPPVEPEPVQAPMQEPTPEVIIDPRVKCQACGSKSWNHKKGCSITK